MYTCKVPDFSTVLGRRGIKEFFVNFHYLLLLLYFTRDRFSLCGSGYPGTHYVSQANIESSCIMLLCAETTSKSHHAMDLFYFY